MKFCHQMSQNWHMTEPYVHAAYLNLWQWINFLLVVVAVEAAIFTIRSTFSFYNSGRMLSCVCQLGTGADGASDYISDRRVEHVCRCSWRVRPLANREQQSRWATAPKNSHYGDSKEWSSIVGEVSAKDNVVIAGVRESSSAGNLLGGVWALPLCVPPSCTNVRTSDTLLSSTTAEWGSCPLFTCQAPDSS